MRSFRSVLNAVIKPKEKEPTGWYWFDTYPVEDFWGSPFYAYYIQEQELGIDAWYVVELRVMREKLPKKDPPKTCREYIVAVVAKTETQDPKGNGFLTFERVKQRKPTTGWDIRGAHPDRTREREVFREKKSLAGGPWDGDFLKHLNYTFNARQRYMHIDRVRISGRPWLYETDETVAVIRLPPPELDATPTIATVTPRQFTASTTRPKCRWLFVWELVYIATRLNQSRELFHIFPETVHWLPGMMMHVVRVWTGSELTLRHRDGKRVAQVGPDQEIQEWYERQEAVMRQQQKDKDKAKEDYSDVIRIIKTPKNSTIRSLVEEYWQYCVTEDVPKMFLDIELKEIQRQRELNEQFREDLDKMRKKTQERVNRVFEQKDKEIYKKQQDMRAQRKVLAAGRKIRLEETPVERKKPGEENRAGPSREVRGEGRSSGTGGGTGAGERRSAELKTEARIGEGSLKTGTRTGESRTSKTETKSGGRSILRTSLEGSGSRTGKERRN